MILIEFLLLLLIAGVCGAIGQSLAGSARGGWLASIGLGFVGALLGGWIARSLGLPSLFAIEIGGSPFPVLWSILGSSLFVVILGMLRRRPARRRG